MRIERKNARTGCSEIPHLCFVDICLDPDADLRVVTVCAQKGKSAWQLCKSEGRERLTQQRILLC